MKKRGFTKEERLKIIKDASENAGRKSLRNVVFALVDQEWLNKVWRSQAEQAGYWVSATIARDDVFVRFIVGRMAKQRDEQFTAKVFKKCEEAHEWRKSID